jgi:FPC/CPF motif-containing protein YcgG
LEFIYDFVDVYRNSKKAFHSAAVLFRKPDIRDEKQFDILLWERLAALRSLDQQKYNYDQRVDDDPGSEKYSFSLKAEAFFIIGIHPASNRNARKFSYPALVFNPHAEFEKLRQTNRYEQMKKVVRKRDQVFSGSVNPMLKDFGEASEVYQYSGIQYGTDWKCPLTKDHGETNHNS